MKKIVLIFLLMSIGIYLPGEFEKPEWTANDEPAIPAMFPELYYEIKIAELNKSTTFELFYDEIVQEYINTFLDSRLNEYLLFRERSESFFPLFEKYLSEYNLPEEIKYLSVVESGLITDARSPSDAVGLWQFKEKTGSHYGLIINNYQDDRLDPKASTIAACKYLHRLYDIFGSWELALLAYNAGPTNLREAIIKNGNQTDYYSLIQYLAPPARRYLPAFVAIIYLFENYEIHF